MLSHYQSCDMNQSFHAEMFHNMAFLHNLFFYAARFPELLLAYLMQRGSSLGV